MVTIQDLFCTLSEFLDFMNRIKDCISKPSKEEVKEEKKERLRCSSCKAFISKDLKCKRCGKDNAESNFN